MRPRIGELLLEHGWVDEANLRRALAEQALAGGKRICSLLIARGLLDPDLAARALGEQLEVAAVLQRHLEHRDRDLAQLLPGAIARSLIALPIGSTRTGELIVCVRDPKPEVEAAIRRALDRPLVIAVAPAARLEQLVDESYEGEGENEFDVDLNTGTQLEPVPAMPAVADAMMPELSALSLVGLDDARVTKDHSPAFITQRETQPPFAAISAALPVPNATPPEPMPVYERPRLELDPDDVEDQPPPPPPLFPPALPPPPSPAIGTQPPRQNKVMIPPVGEPLPRGPSKTPTTPQPMVRLTIGEVVAAIADAVSRDSATDVAMRYAAQRWVAGLLLAVKEGAALGHRGHGKHLSADAVRAVAIPLSSPSILKAAHENRALTTEVPGNVGAIHDRLIRLLGLPRHPMAVPVMVAGRIACLMVVGDALGTEDTSSDLAKLAEALGEAYTRILREMK